MLKKFISFSALLIVVLTFIAAGSLIVDAQSVRAKGEIAGTNQDDQSILVTTENGFLTISVDGSTRMTRSKQPVMFTDIEVGDSVDLRYEAGTMTAQSISLKRPFIEGFITAISGNYVPIQNITITPFRGKPVTLAIQRSTRICKDNQQAQFTDLLIGDYAKANFDSKSMLATVLSAWSPITTSGPGLTEGLAGFKGFVTSLKWTVLRLEMVVKPLVGKAGTFFVTSQTVIKLNGSAAVISDIQINDLVDVKFRKETMVATQVLITRPDPGPVSIQGIISAIQIKNDVNQTYLITIQQSRGKVITLQISPSAIIERDSQPAEASELMVGDFVVAKFDPTTLTIFELSAFSNN